MNFSKSVLLTVLVCGLYASAQNNPQPSTNGPRPGDKPMNGQPMPSPNGPNNMGQPGPGGPGGPNNMGQPGPGGPGGPNNMGQPGPGGPGGPNSMGQPGPGGPGGPNNMGQPGPGGPGGPNSMGQPGPGGPGGPNSMGQPGPGGPGGPNSMGQPGPGGTNNNQKQVAPWPPAKCEKEIPKLKKAAENCVRVAKEDKRRECFDKIGNSMPKDFFEGCRAIVEPIKNEIEQKVKQKYPNQATGLDGGGNNGPQNGPNGGPNGVPMEHKGPKADCAKEIPAVKKMGEPCLKLKDQSKRKACFDKVGQYVNSKGLEEACRSAIEPLKAEFQQKEAQAYPGQPPSIN